MRLTESWGCTLPGRPPSPPPSKKQVRFVSDEHFVVETIRFSFFKNDKSLDVQDFKFGLTMDVFHISEFEDYYDIIVQDTAGRNIMDGGKRVTIYSVPKSLVEIIEHREIPTSVPPPRKR